MDKKSLEMDLCNFFGTENYYKHHLGITFTDGIKFLAERANAYWLIDLIASYQPNLKNEWFQSWVLKKLENKWEITCDDGNGNILKNQLIEYSDFPLGKIKLFLVDSVLMLTTEY